MSEELVDQLERMFAARIDILGGFGPAVDLIGDKFSRNFEFRAIVLGRNLSMQTHVPESKERHIVEYVVRQLANSAMDRAFKLAAMKEKEAEGYGK